MVSKQNQPVANSNQMKNHSAHKSRKTFNGLGYQLVDNDIQEGTQQRMIIQTRTEIDIPWSLLSKLQNWVMYEIV